VNLIKTIARLNVTAIWKLARLSIVNFGYLWPTYKATKACMAISSQHFGRKHYQNGQANAFRHALWNVLIAKKCYALTKTVEKAVLWTKNITDWHEEAFFSKELPMKMDYHNNAFGRLLFREHWQWTEEQFINQLLLLTKEALKISEESDLNKIKNQLVYLADDH